MVPSTRELARHFFCHSARVAVVKEISVNEAQSKAPTLDARAPGAARVLLLAMICLTGCSEDASVHEASEAPRPTQAPTSPHATATSQGRLYRVFDRIGSWPALHMTDLRAHLAPSAALDIVGGTSPIVGSEEIARALTRLQATTPFRRLHLVRSYETAQSLAIEFEFWRCQGPQGQGCASMRAGVLYAWKAGATVQRMKLFLGDDWLPRPELVSRPKATRWVVGRRHAKLELLFDQIWQGSLAEWVAPELVFRDMATGLETRGLAAFTAHRAAHAAAMPAGACTVQEMRSVGDIVMALSRCEGVLDRPLRGEGRTFSVQLLDVGRFKELKLVELRTYSSPQEALQTLGRGAQTGGAP